MNPTTQDETSPILDLSASQVCQSPGEDILRPGAPRLLPAAIEAEVAQYVDQHVAERDPHGHRLVTRNGTQPARSLQTGRGPIPLRQPRVHDRRPGHQFTRAILPPDLRRVPSLENLIPALYLRGVSPNDMPPALEALLGPQAAGLSPTTIGRLKAVWEADCPQWQQRDLSSKHYVYFWAEGIYFNVRLSDERPCVRVIVGALADGAKELVALQDGPRESKLSWQELLSDLQRRGLSVAPKLAVGDGALGFWAALEEEFPATGQQRCWVHKTANVRDQLPQCVQPGAKQHRPQIYLAPTREQARQARAQFMRLYEAKYPRAWACLAGDQEARLAFYDYPAEHWRHLRTPNPIESTFATVRHRPRQTKGCGSRRATLGMGFQLLRPAEGGWRRLNGAAPLDKVIAGVVFVDGEEPRSDEAQPTEQAA